MKINGSLTKLSNTKQAKFHHQRLAISFIQEKYGNRHMSVTQKKTTPKCTHNEEICMNIRSNQICNCK